MARRKDPRRKKAAGPKPTQAPKAAPRPTVRIGECPAAERCKERQASCEVCQELSEEDWRKHVRAVLAAP